MMTELVQNSAEHHFLTTMEKLKTRPNGWYGLYFSLSKLVNHADITSDLSAIPEKLAVAQKKRDNFLKRLQDELGDGFKGYIYTFSDLDILALVVVNDENEKKHVAAAYSKLAGALAEGFADMSMLTSAFRNYQKLADEKILSAQRFGAYLSMADKNKVGSISTRRARRDAPRVMVVEDDRFTLHYASGILSKDYDLVVAKSGEDAIGLYIENAPDIVFLDIHLPGISGHEALQAIHAVDPKAYVVMLSVDAVHDNISRASRLGADKFLKKPFSKERLVETVKTSPFVKAMTLAATEKGSTTLIH